MAQDGAMTPMIIGDERVLTDEGIEVRSPYDGRLVGTVPKATAEHIDQAVARRLGPSTRPGSRRLWLARWAVRCCRSTHPRRVLANSGS